MHLLGLAWFFLFTFLSVIQLHCNRKWSIDLLRVGTMNRFVVISARVYFSSLQFRAWHFTSGYSSMGYPCCNRYGCTGELVSYSFHFFIVYQIFSLLLISFSRTRAMFLICSHPRMRVKHPFSLSCHTFLNIQANVSHLFAFPYKYYDMIKSCELGFAIYIFF